MKSKNWDRFKDTASFVRDGFPFDEGFPAQARGKMFHLVKRDGTHCLAEVDYSTQYRAEGLTWRIIAERAPSGDWIRCHDMTYGHVVLCWKLHEEETRPSAA